MFALSQKGLWVTVGPSFNTSLRGPRTRISAALQKWSLSRQILVPLAPFPHRDCHSALIARMFPLLTNFSLRLVFDSEAVDVRPET